MTDPATTAAPDRLRDAPPAYGDTNVCGVYRQPEDDPHAPMLTTVTAGVRLFETTPAHLRASVDATGLPRDRAALARLRTHPSGVGTTDPGRIRSAAAGGELP